MTGIKPDRRQVVRAGAWTVPAIAVAVAAPAFAASNKADLTKSTSGNAQRNGGQGNNQTITVPVTVSNLDGNRITEGLTVAITIPQGIKPAAQQVAPIGWTTTLPTVSGQTITFTRDEQVPGGTAIPAVTFTVAYSSNGTGNTVTIVIASYGPEDVNKTLTPSLV